MNTRTHQAREARAATGIAALVALVGCISALIPVVEHTITTLILGATALAVLVIGLRLAARWIRERREDRQDAVTAAAWRAAHARPPVVYAVAEQIRPAQPIGPAAGVEQIEGVA